MLCFVKGIGCDNHRSSRQYSLLTVLDGHVLQGVGSIARLEIRIKICFVRRKLANYIIPCDFVMQT